jgi:hypothetical protein
MLRLRRSYSPSPYFANKVRLETVIIKYVHGLLVLKMGPQGIGRSKTFIISCESNAK